MWLASPTILPSSERPQRRILDRLACFLVDDVEHVLKVASGGFRRLPADKFLGDGIEEVHSPFGVGADDRIADARQRNVQPLSLLLDESGILFGHTTGGGFFHEAAGVSSARFRSVMSLVIFENPRRFPPSSCSAVMTTLAQNCEPSLRTRQPSSSNRPSAAATLSSWSGQPRSMASWG